jgi:uncharacterized protein
MPNRLAEATSPYLLQHADNPVDWHEWGDDAFAEARERDVPIFLSVGYSSCHWCHVMAHESFEDDDVGGYLNDHFVSVKVDREERPDVDAVYMEAVQALTGRGGWPMSVFLDHDGRPFYGGTYWPREARHGMPGFVDVLAAVVDAWRTRRDEVTGGAERIAAAVAERQAAGTATDAGPDLAIADEAARLVIDQAWDRDLGGFGRAPKFPQAMTIRWLLDRHVRTGQTGPLTAALHSLDAMARGGIHDHVAGGFARYSTDAQWLVPHFEKMLYDNALLLDAYATAAAVSGHAVMQRTARGIAEYLLRDLRDPSGAFWSATDADSEGEEGRFFVWSLAELREVVASVDADPDILAAFFGATEAGNFEGANILHEPLPREQFATERGLDLDAFSADLERVRGALYDRREQRVHPGLDDKLLASWNALAIRGLVTAGRLLDEPRYLDAALGAADAVVDLLEVDGALHHSYKDGQVGAPAFLEDVAGMAAASLDLYEVTGDRGWYDRAERHATDAVERFADADGTFFSTASDAESLYTRPKDTWDNATPSGNSLVAEVFARLAAMTGDHTWRDRAERLVAAFQSQVGRMPTGYGQLLQVVERLTAEPTEVAIVGPEGEARDRLVDTVLARPRVGEVLAVADGPAERPALLRDRPAGSDGPLAYVCHGFVCDRPVADPAALADRLAG